MSQRTSLESSDLSNSDGDNGEEQSEQLKPRRLQAPSKKMFTKSPKASENTDDPPGPKGEVRRSSRRVSSQHPSPATANTAGSDEFSEPDPDSSDEWLPSGSTALSPDAPDRNERGEKLILIALFFSTQEAI